MKRKEKSGSQKRTESKCKDLRTSASAPGQRKIFDAFQKTSTGNTSGSNFQSAKNTVNNTGRAININEQRSDR